MALVIYLVTDTNRQLLSDQLISNSRFTSERKVEPNGSRNTSKSFKVLTRGQPPTLYYQSSTIISECNRDRRYQKKIGQSLFTIDFILQHPSVKSVLQSVAELPLINYRLPLN